MMGFSGSGSLMNLEVWIDTNFIRGDYRNLEIEYLHKYSDFTFFLVQLELSTVCICFNSIGLST